MAERISSRVWELRPVRVIIGLAPLCRLDSFPSSVQTEKCCCCRRRTLIELHHQRNEQREKLFSQSERRCAEACVQVRHPVFSDRRKHLEQSRCKRCFLFWLEAHCTSLSEGIQHPCSTAAEFKAVCFGLFVLIVTSWTLNISVLSF